MSVESRLTSVYNSSKQISINENSKIVFMSDCHRGDSSWRDNLEPNRNIYYAALNHYYNNNFTYIEIGDGDELWENRKLDVIWSSYEDIFELLDKFYLRKRLYMIFGNHDKAKANKNFIKKNNLNFIGKDLYEKADITEGLILNYCCENNKIFVVHGHQGDLINDTFPYIGQFGVRYIWSPLEGFFGFKNPTSPAKNYKKKSIVERKIIQWIKKNNCIVIAGHTHRPHFPKPTNPPYFNDGSCVHPYSITCLELSKGEISLIRWKVKTREDNTFFAHREILCGPEPILNYFENLNNKSKIIIKKNESL